MAISYAIVSFFFFLALTMQVTYGVDKLTKEDYEAAEKYCLEQEGIDQNQFTEYKKKGLHGKIYSCIGKHAGLDTDGILDPQKMDQAVAAHGPMMNSQRKRITKCFEECESRKPKDENDRLRMVVNCFFHVKDDIDREEEKQKAGRK